MKNPLITLFTVGFLVGFASAQSTMPTTQTLASEANPSTAPTTQSTQLTRSTTQPSYQSRGNNNDKNNYNNGNNFNNRRFSRRGNLDNGRNTSASAVSDGTPQPRQISNQFQVVLDRNIFIHGYQIQREGDNPNPNPREDIRPPYQPEAALVFNGVTSADAAVAMVENTDTHEISRLRVGDQIGRDKITGITMNNLDYEVGGRTTHVQFGQTFAGGVPQTILGALASPAATGTGTGTATSQPATNLPLTRQLGESVEDYLRRRRAMGL